MADVFFFFAFLMATDLVGEISASSQRVSNIIPAPFFDAGENLSFGNCGVWNWSDESTQRDSAPWHASILLDAKFICDGIIISRRTIISRICLLADDDSKIVKSGLAKAHIGKCTETYKTCSYGSSEGQVVKVKELVEMAFYELWKTEKMAEFNDFFSAICLFNRGNQLDFQQATENSSYQGWDHIWEGHAQVERLEPIENCLNNATISKLQKQEPNPLNWLICSSVPYFLYLTFYDAGRYLIRGLKSFEYSEMDGLNGTTHALYLDFLPFTQQIVQQSSGLAVLPKIPPPIHNKKFKGNLSFPNCGQKAKNRRRKRSEDDYPEEEPDPVVFILFGQTGKRDSHPWHAEIEIKINENSGFCGGTLISKKAVLTAAHCFYSADQVAVDKIKVSVGLYDKRRRNENEIQSKIPSRLVIHENYTSGTFENDIALLIFDQDFQVNEKVCPICLWNKDFDLDRVADQFAVAVGWGLIENYTETNILQEAKLPIKSHKDCFVQNKRFFGKYLKPGKNFCAGYTNGTTVCNGDSGGGLSIKKDGKWFIRGLVSFGNSHKIDNEEQKVCHPNSYSIFTDLGAYMDWIVQNTPDISTDQ